MTTIALIGKDESNKYFENYFNILLKDELKKFSDKNQVVFIICEHFSGLNSIKKLVSGIYIALELSLEKENFIIFCSILDYSSLEAKYSKDFKELMARTNVVFFKSLEVNPKRGFVQVFNELMSKNGLT